MVKTAAPTHLPAIRLDLNSAVPLHRQIYEGVRVAILGGQLTARTRLPSTRDLAAALGVSRNTILGAFDQLIAEGYLEGQVGSGTYVARSLPDEMLAVRAAAPERPASDPVESPLSRRGALLASTRLPGTGGFEPRAF
ncbi:MAG TPA: winged helix-turn-helix domain-containing protein, partial [Dehalococcoidia bacterium]|nr:winged helix-turn-helix domain-containing protein [Dehalococcoidia bacterium]